MRIAAAFRRVTISFELATEPIRRAIASVQQVADGLADTETELRKRRWEDGPDAHHWVANPGRIRQDTSHPDEG
jgi:hypothetical protein